MKTLLLLLLLVPMMSFGQVFEGYIQYDIHFQSIDSLNSTKQKIALLRDSKMELYFAEKKYRIDFKMGKMYTSSIRVNKSTNAAISLMNNMKGKHATLSYADEIKYNIPDKNSECMLINEKKVILGFKCKKAIIISNDQKSTYWYTKEINLNGAESTFTNPLIPGFPMKFSQLENGLKMTFTASNFKESIEDKLETFSTLPPSGYQVTN